MIEIVCPSCQTRYELPDNAIGPDGRKVSCSNCSHKWRAYPEPRDDEPAGAPAEESRMPAGVEAAPHPVREPAPIADHGARPGPQAAAPQEPAPAPPPVPRSDPAPAAMPSAPAAASGPRPVDEPEAPAVAPSPPPGAGDRASQMAAIRQMLSDLKETSETVPERDLSAPRPVDRDEGPRQSRNAGDDRDPLKARIDELEGHVRAVKGEPQPSGYDAHKLRRRHEKRAKQFQRARERRKKSGAFITGFTFVAVVAGTLSGLYVLHPQIIAASPKMEPAMTEYVVTIDHLRSDFDDATAQWRTWLEDRIANLTAKAEKQKGG